SDVYKNIALGTAVGGKVEVGVLGVGDKLLCIPTGTLVTVRTIMTHSDYVEWAVAGDNIDLGITCADPSVIRVGDILCDPERPVPAVTRFKARIALFATDIPITKGLHVMLHVHSIAIGAVLSRLIALIDTSTGQIKRKRPRCLVDKNTADVEITTRVP